MAKIWFGRPGTHPTKVTSKGKRNFSWFMNNLVPLTIISPQSRLPRMPDEESPIPPSMRTYKDMVVTIEEENDDLPPGYYLSTPTPKEVREKLQETGNR